MTNYPAPLRRLIEAFLVLPGIGRRTAERFAFSLMQGAPSEASELATAINEIHRTLTTCEWCGQFSESARCNICSDSRRDQQLLCVVADSRDIVPMEQTGQYRGLYYVLGGLLDPIEGITPERLRFESLKTRLQQGVTEVILALNATLDGDTTASYIAKILKPTVRVTRLGRGLPTGSRLEYADEATLTSALSNRQEV